MSPSETLSEADRLQALRALLHEPQRASSSLPALEPDTAWLERAWNSLVEWVGAHLPNFKFRPPRFDLPLDPEMLWTIFQVTVWCALAVLLGWVVLRMVQGVRNPQIRSGSVSAATPLLPEVVSSLCQQGLWAEALRVRWRLFLSRLNRPLSVTPREMALDADRMLDPDLLYHGMFSSMPKLDRERFAELDGALSALEKPAT